MNKGALVEHLAKSGLETKVAAEQAINAVLTGIQQGLEQDGKVQLVGFGSFEVKQRKARTGRNPRTGAKIQIPAGQSVTFRAGNSLKSAVKSNGKGKK